MGFYDYSDAAMCRIFITTLVKTAKQWIVSLPAGSISSWNELCDRFHERFGSNRRRGKLTASLMQIKQKVGESLGQYVQRFRDAVGTVADLNVTQALGFFTTGLDVSRSKKLMKDIMFNPPKDLADAYERAEKFVAIDEAMSNLNPVQKMVDRPKSNGARPEVWDRVGPKANPPQMERPSFQPRQEENKVYTPLNTSMVQILEENKGKLSFNPPELKSHLWRGNKNYFCNYHQVAGHSTEACRALKNLVEEKVQNGELVQYVVGQKVLSVDQTKEKGRGDDRGGQPRRVID